MDFFSAQDDARKKTKWLIFLFAVGLLALVILTNLFSLQQGMSQLQSQFNWPRFLGVGAAVVMVVFLGSAYRTMSLSKGPTGYRGRTKPR